MADYLQGVVDVLVTLWGYALPIIAGIGSASWAAARQAAFFPIATAIAAFFLRLPWPVWNTTAKDLGWSVLFLVAGFVIAAALGAVLSGVLL